MRRNVMIYCCFLIICVAFLSLPCYMAYQKGLCCYDDAGYAIVAKNMMNGVGYATTINYIGSNYGVSLFDPALGQGPFGILPVAFAFKLFGLSPFIPGYMQIAFEFLLLLISMIWLLRRYPFWRILIAFSLSLCLITLISDFHYEHWYAMLGESIAALLLFLGFVAWDKDGPSRRAGLTAGFLLGLAVLTKEIAAIFVVVFVLVAAWQIVVRPPARQPSRAGRWQILACLILSGLLPFLCFEVWKCTVLGWPAYRTNWHQHVTFIASYAPRAGFWQNLLMRNQIFAQHYFLNSIAVFIIIFYVLCLNFISIKKTSLIYTLGYGCLAFFGYWVFFSTGPARHLYIGIIIFCFLVTTPLLFLSKKMLVLGIIPWICCFFPLIPQAVSDYTTKVTTAIQNSERENGREEYKSEYSILHALGDFPKQQDRVYTPAWAHVVMLEYLSPGYGLFAGWERMPPDATGTVVLNDRITKLFGKSKEYAVFLQRRNCHQRYRRAPYTVYFCGPFTKK